MALFSHMKTSAVRNFHLPLSAELYDELREQARRRGRPATVIAREALEEGLRVRRAQELHEEIAQYAREHADTAADLDPALEKAGLQSLARKRRRR